MASVPPWPLKLLILAVGAAFGSFANVLIFRIPQGLSIIRPGSYCPKCGAKIRWYDNIPVFSFVALGGRCRACRASISIRYPLIEMAAALLALANLHLAWFISWPVSSLAGTLSIWAFLFAFSLILLIVTFIDLEHWRIPPILCVIGAALGVLFSLVAGKLTGVLWWSSLTGMVAGSLALVAIIEGYRKVTGREGMGYGDVFLMAMVGSYLGVQALPFVFFAASAQGLLVAVPLVLLKGTLKPPWELRNEQENKPLPIRHAPLPFGPFIALAALEWLFFQDLVRSFWPLLG